MTRPVDKGKTFKSSLWLSRDVVLAADEKATRIGFSRSKYIELLLRRDLGFETFDQRSTVTTDRGEAA
jgi:hypothetical protein